MRRLDHEEELLDGPLPDPAVLAESLRDLRRVNRWLGGVALSRSALIRLMTGAHYGPRPNRPTGRAMPFRLLDVGTGGADIPLALLDWAGAHRRELEIVAVDQRPEMIAIAAEVARGHPRLALGVADGRSLSYSADAFDVAHTSLVAHHLDPAALAALLAELRRVSRLGVIVNDLDRGRLAWFLAVLLSRIFTRNPLTRHDGPLSVRRAYHPWEIAQIAASVGLIEVTRIRGFLGHRYALVFVRRSSGEPGANRST
ncbi:MAG: methyltransferase domain-containing protein [Chloroflexi bacterium]|nr:methyltransferase domain-containing protein [Chloroflexota bacterium]